MGDSQTTGDLSAFKGDGRHQSLKAEITLQQEFMLRPRRLPYKFNPFTYKPQLRLSLQKTYAHPFVCNRHAPLSLDPPFYRGVLGKGKAQGQEVRVEGFMANGICACGLVNTSLYLRGNDVTVGC